MSFLPSLTNSSPEETTAGYAEGETPSRPLRADPDYAIHDVPGIQIPENAKNIKEFSEVRDVDAKQLNASLKKE